MDDAKDVEDGDDGDGEDAQQGVGPVFLLDRSPTALVEHGQGGHLRHLQDRRTSRDRKDSLPGEQILSERRKNIKQSQVQLSKALLTVAGSPFYASLYRFALDINFPGLCR